MLDRKNPDDVPPMEKVRPLGRTLSEFRIAELETASGLLPAEDKLLDAVFAGDCCTLSEERPETASEDNRVRAGFLRFLALGGDDSAPVHEKGVQLRGAFIEGALDLDYAACSGPLRLVHCMIDGPISAHNTKFLELNLDGSQCEGANFDDATFKGTASLRQKFRCIGSLRFTGARIGGDLDLTGAILENPNGDALACRRSQIRRSVFLTQGFTSTGKVRFSGAEIGGDFTAFGGRFIQNNAAATPVDWREKPRADDALTLTNAKIEGLVWLGPYSAPYDKQVQIEGSLNLQGAQVNVLVDNEQSWPVAYIETAQGHIPCDILLDGFVYRRFAKTIDVDERRRWLLRQGAMRGDGPIPPQPFEQLIKVLREMGHDQEARQIGLLKESLLRPMNIRATSAWTRPFVLLMDHLYNFFCGYGYRPHRLGVSIFVLWIACAWFFHIAEEQGAFAPNDPEIWANAELKKTCKGKRWTACSDVYNLIPFNAATYAADTIIPIIDLQQRSAWAPVLKTINVSIPYLGQKKLPAGTLHVVIWCANIFGALAVILLGAIASGLIKKD